MKKIFILNLIFIFSILSFSFAQEIDSQGRYQVVISESESGDRIIIKCDTLTGRTWKLNLDDDPEWVEIKDYGKVFSENKEETDLRVIDMQVGVQISGEQVAKDAGSRLIEFDVVE